jgi:hypothetical protein
MRIPTALAAVLLAATLSGTAAAQAPPQQTERERDELVGPVKTVEVASSLPGDSSRFEPVHTSTYGPAGELSERVFYVDGAVAARVTYRDGGPGVRVAASTTPEAMGYGVRVTRLQPRERAGGPFVAAADGTYAFAVVRSFDAAGRLLEERTIAGAEPGKGPLIARVTYRYDAKGRLSERTRLYGTPPVPFEKETYGYGADDRVSEAVHYRQRNLLAARRTFAYETDERGNWTKRTETHMLGGTPVVAVTTRKIAYY